ncbi:hypothetical protein HCDG_07379 [Histoplasma capsulatum H143]|uniref:Uncharacterized protein n=1 Tax=Ajellomyces capsulatus (strain H143) TaxID=544712 RepID=C6HMR3_AJECH|nr:hypothetical protein HCDG_07379 [Histoplasma capsulatum H143]
MPFQPSKFTELLDTEKLQQHTFSDADVRLEDILAVEAARAASTPRRAMVGRSLTSIPPPSQATGTSRRAMMNRSRSTTSSSSVSSSLSLSSSSSSSGSRTNFASQTKLAFRKIAFPSR